MTLRFNIKTQEYVLISNDEEMAKSVGLTLSTSVRGPGGEKVWFTDNPYAALSFYNEATDEVKLKLSKLYADYKESRAKTSDENFPCPADQEYRPFQQAGIAYALKRQNVLIGDEPGLGKTIQLIGIANAVEAKKILIICPASIRIYWQRKIEEWSTIKGVTTFPVLKSSDGVNPYSNYVIISYELARNPKIHKELCEIEWDILGLDEAHFLKNGEAKRTRAVFGGGTGIFKEAHISKHCKRIVALTGTPLPNRPRECYMIARALHWESIDWVSYDNFCYRFNPSGIVESGHNLEMEGRLPELQARLRCNFMIRRLAVDVWEDLPSKNYEMVPLEINGAIKKVLAREQLIDFNPGDFYNPNFKIDGQVATLRREMGEAKLPRVIEYLKYILDDLEIPKIAIFSYHRSVMDGLIDSLGKYGLVSHRGGMTTKAKQQSIDDFVNDPGIRIFNGQLDASGFGVDGLQHATNRVFFVEPAWVPGTNEQIVRRVFRMGQHDNVLAEFLVVEDSFDYRVIGPMIKKAKNIHKALDHENIS